MNCIIIEDEKKASDRLIRLIQTHLNHLEVDAVLTSVEDSIEYLKKHNHPKVIFMDIELKDGLSFSIFDKIKLTAPVIFISAHDKYALKAHKRRALDYLLKPIKKDQLINAVEKLSSERPKGLSTNKKENTTNLTFVVQFGSRYYITTSEDIAYIQKAENITMMTRKDKVRFPVKLNITEIIQVLPNHKFFQVSDSLIVSIDAIKFLEYKNKVPTITLDPKVDKPIRVGKEYINPFNSWLQQQYS